MQVVEKDTVKSVMQNIKIILTTQRGTDPHRPDFGSDVWQFIDQPLTAITMGKIKAEITDAIERFEPRVKVKSVLLQKAYAGIKVSIEVQLLDTGDIITVPLWLM
jgi:phage baseplate assembly protein W